MALRATDSEAMTSIKYKAVLHRLVQCVPGLRRLRDVLIIREEAEGPIDLLLHGNNPYDEPPAEHMVLMLRTGIKVELIIQRVERCKVQLEVLATDNSQ